MRKSWEDILHVRYSWMLGELSGTVPMSKVEQKILKSACGIKRLAPLKASRSNWLVAGHRYISPIKDRSNFQQRSIWRVLLVEFAQICVK